MKFYRYGDNFCDHFQLEIYFLPYGTESIQCDLQHYGNVCDVVLLSIFYEILTEEEQFKCKRAFLVE